MQPILADLKKLTLAPARMTDAEAAAAYAAGWDERALHDAISVACSFAFMNRLVFGHGVRPLPEQFTARGEAHKTDGYDKARRDSEAAAQ